MQVSGLESTPECMPWLHLVYMNGRLQRNSKTLKNFSDIKLFSHDSKISMSFSYVLDTYFFMCKIQVRSTLKTVRHTSNFPEVLTETSFSLKKLNPKQRKSYQKT